MIDIINKLIERVAETGEEINELVVTENIKTATLTDDTGEVFSVEYDRNSNEWE